MAENEIWGLIKIVRARHLEQNPDIECVDGFIAEHEIVLILNQVSNLVGNKKLSHEMNGKLSKKNFDLEANMFVALNSCPSFFVNLYRRAIYGPQTRMIMMTLNIIKKSEEHFKIKAKKIFSKLSSMFNFQHIINHQDIKENFEFGKDMDVKGNKKTKYIF